MKQRSAEWFSAREGKLTASNMAAAMNFNKNGKESAERRNLKIELLAERMTGVIVPHFVSKEMQWGIDHEQEAKAAYEAHTGNLLGELAYVDHPSIDCCGASPDSTIDDDGLAEFKCPMTSTHIAYMLAGVVPEEYKPQMILQAACTGRKWIDFVSYDPRLPPKQRLFIKRFVPTSDEIKEVEDAAIKFLNELDMMFEQITNMEIAA